MLEIWEILKAQCVVFAVKENKKEGKEGVILKLGNMLKPCETTNNR